MDAGFLWRPAAQRHKLLLLQLSHWALPCTCERRSFIFQYSHHKLSLAARPGRKQRSQCCRAACKWFVYTIWPLQVRCWVLGSSEHSLPFIQHAAPPVGHPVCLHQRHLNVPGLPSLRPTGGRSSPVVESCTKAKATARMAPLWEQGQLIIIQYLFHYSELCVSLLRPRSLKDTGWPKYHVCFSLWFFPLFSLTQKMLLEEKSHHIIFLRMPEWLLKISPGKFREGPNYLKISLVEWVLWLVHSKER